MNKIENFVGDVYQDSNGNKYGYASVNTPGLSSLSAGVSTPLKSWENEIKPTFKEQWLGLGVDGGGIIGENIKEFTVGAARDIFIKGPQAMQFFMEKATDPFNRREDPKMFEPFGVEAPKTGRQAMGYFGDGVLSGTLVLAQVLSGGTATPLITTLGLGRTYKALSAADKIGDQIAITKAMNNIRKNGSAVEKAMLTARTVTGEAIGDSYRKVLNASIEGGLIGAAYSTTGAWSEDRSATLKDIGLGYTLGVTLGALAGAAGVKTNSLTKVVDDASVNNQIDAASGATTESIRVEPGMQREFKKGVQAIKNYQTKLQEYKAAQVSAERLTDTTVSNAAKDLASIDEQLSQLALRKKGPVPEANKLDIDSEMQDLLLKREGILRAASKKVTTNSRIEKIKEEKNIIARENELYAKEAAKNLGVKPKDLLKSIPKGSKNYFVKKIQKNNKKLKELEAREAAVTDIKNDPALSKLIQNKAKIISIKDDIEELTATRTASNSKRTDKTIESLNKKIATLEEENKSLVPAKVDKLKQKVINTESRLLAAEETNKKLVKNIAKNLKVPEESVKEALNGILNRKRSVGKSSIVTNEAIKNAALNAPDITGLRAMPLKAGLSSFVRVLTILDGGTTGFLTKTVGMPVLKGISKYTQAVKNKKLAIQDFIDGLIDENSRFSGALHRAGLARPNAGPKSELSEIVQEFGEKTSMAKYDTLSPSDKAIVKQIAAKLRSEYDDYIDKLNETFKTAGIKLVIKKRKDYFRHTQEISAFDKVFGITNAKSIELGMKAGFFESGSTPINPDAVKAVTGGLEKARKGGEYINDAIGGFFQYVDLAERTINLQESIEFIQSVKKYFKPNVQSWMDNFQNRLRGLPENIDTAILKNADNVRYGIKQLNNLSTLGNLGFSVSTAGIQITAIAPTLAFAGLRSSAKAFLDMSKLIVPGRNDIKEVVANAPYLQRRIADVGISVTGDRLEAVARAAAFVTSRIDAIMTTHGYLAALRKNQSLGFKGQDLLDQTDILASRMHGETAHELLTAAGRSDLAKASISKFQNFTINAFEQLTVDLPAMYKTEGGVAVSKAILTYMTTGYALNLMAEEMGISPPFQVTSFLPFGYNIENESLSPVGGLAWNSIKLGYSAVRGNSQQSTEAIQNLNKILPGFFPAGRQASRVAGVVEAQLNEGAFTGIDVLGDIVPIDFVNFAAGTDISPDSPKFYIEDNPGMAKLLQYYSYGAYVSPGGQAYVDEIEEREAMNASNRFTKNKANELEIAVQNMLSSQEMDATGEVATEPINP